VDDGGDNLFCSSVRNRDVMGTEIGVDMMATRCFCLETVVKFTDSRPSNGMPDIISGAFRLRRERDIFKKSQQSPERGMMGVPPVTVIGTTALGNLEEGGKVRVALYACLRTA